MDAADPAMLRTPIRRALLSVYYKDGVVDLARALVEHGAQLLSTGGTMQAIRAAGLPVTEVADYTGFPEMLDGRVKTLHPMIHGGLLARRDVAEHVEAMNKAGMGPIDLVCVNLYPFEETAANSSASRQEVIEKIDIGGPSMLRSAAKNHDSVAVVCDPADYAPVGEEIAQGGTTLATRRRLARKAFARTASYDAAIAEWFLNEERLSGMDEGSWPEHWLQTGTKQAELRYGENPHQRAAFYADAQPHGLSAAELLPGGKAISYNNYLDLDAAVRLAGELGKPAAVVVKHNNPCGAAVGYNNKSALEGAWEGDPLSAFGSVIALRGKLDLESAEFLGSGQKFVEALAAEEFEEAAVEYLRSKPKWGKNLRLIRVPDMGAIESKVEARRIWGGTLVQSTDDLSPFDEEFKVVGRHTIGERKMDELQMAQTIAKYLKSNSICLVKGNRLVGAGAGQMSRVDSARIAIEKAGDRAQGAVAGSDAFFPFPDGVETLAKAGVKAVVQPGGSLRDAEVTAAADELGIVMVHSGKRHFRH